MKYSIADKIFLFPSQNFSFSSWSRHYPKLHVHCYTLFLGFNTVSCACFHFVIVTLLFYYLFYCINTFHIMHKFNLIALICRCKICILFICSLIYECDGLVIFTNKCFSEYLFISMYTCMNFFRNAEILLHDFFHVVL